MSFWTLENIRAVTAGRWLGRARGEGMVVELRGVSTDSRSIRPGEVFVAIAGERFDGHAYVKQAIGAGSPLVVVEREDAVEGMDTGGAAVLKVDSTLAALSRMAAAYRKTLSAEVIAVTGSVGKTTTKQIIHAVLGTQLRGKASPKSYNNHIGVPLTLLSVEGGDRYVVVEIGTNAPGEIAALARIVEPDVAVITQIGEAHTEKLGGLEGVAREKAAVLGYLKEGGVAIVNGDCAVLGPHLKVAPSLVRFGKGENCDLRLTGYVMDERGMEFEVNKRVKLRVPLLGEHNAVNALAAVAVARHMNMSDAQIGEGLARVEGAVMRLSVEKVGEGEGVTLINDAYNANPMSMRAALQVLREYPTKGRRVAILGDMLELGQLTPQLHRELGQEVVKAGVDVVVFIGRASLYGAEAVARVWPEQRVHAIPEWGTQTGEEVAGWVTEGDVVLIKGSRAMGMERIAEAVKARFGAEAR